jgi:hypothetical protein
LRTSTWTKAPVSFWISQGALVSQALSRRMTSPALSACPGFIVSSREMPLRLLRSPITATRSAIGVVPGAIAVTVWGISTVSGSRSAPAFCFTFGSGIPLLHAPSASAAANALPSKTYLERDKPRIGYSGVQAS